MRPTPDRSHDHDSHGRIIYLGDVRRRRTGRNRAPDKHYLGVLGLIAALAWVVWVGVLLVVPPARLLTYLAFFAPLTVALSATAALGIYAVEWRQGIQPELGECLRRGLLAALVVVANLSLLAAHLWMLPLAAVSVAAAVAIDLGIRMRRTTFARYRRR